MSRIVTVGLDYTISGGAQFGNPNSNNTWQPWNQLTASSPIDCDELIFYGGASYYMNYGLYELGVGPAGSEVVIGGPFIACQLANSTNNIPALIVKLQQKIPAGTRIAWRVQMNNNNQYGGASLMLINRGNSKGEHIGIIDSLGSVLTNSSGTAVNPGTTANAKGAWVQLIASTVHDYKALILGLSFSGGSSGTDSYLFDIGVGAAGSEQIVVPDFWAGCDNTAFVHNASPEFPVNVPAGSRIAVRCQCTTASSIAYVNLLGLM